MAIFDRFTAKKEENKKSAHAGEITHAKKAEKTEQSKIVLKKITGVLLRAHLTEKSAHSAKEGKYVFSVNMGAGKLAIKRAIESRYGVLVVSVHTLHTKGKERRRGRVTGWKPGFKKAVVSLAKDQNIEIL